ncbi:MAG: hypothetical protein Tsb0021_10200 [Chlamydiales bacterium]
MKKTIEAIQSFVEGTLHVKVKILLWKGKKSLPFFLIDSYEFYELSLLGQTCLMLVNKTNVELTPSTIRKHIELLQEKWEGLSIYADSVISSYNRKRLIEQQVPFIVPGNQLYLPDLGIDLKEHFRRLRSTKQCFSPVTQVVLLYILNFGIDERYIPTQLGKKLGYSFMSMTRAFDELETFGIGEIQRQGKERSLNFKQSKRELWEQAKKYMRNPVKQRKWLQGRKPKVNAGLSALAQFSMLNPPQIPIYALSHDEWKKWKESGVEELPAPEKDAYELEIWHYSPTLFAQKGLVDPFSLYLSLQESEDERIETAIAEMMENTL